MNEPSPQGNGRTWATLMAVWAGAYAASLETGIFLAQVFAGLGGLLIIVGLARKHIVRPIGHRAVWALIAIAAIFIVSSIISVSPVHSFNKIGRNFVFPTVGFFATLMLTRSVKVRRVAFNVLVIAGVFGALVGLFQHLAGFDPIYGQEIKGPIRGSVFPIYVPKGLLDMTLTYAGMQVTIFLFALPAVWRMRGRRNLWYWIALGLILLSVFITYKRGPWLAIVAGTGLFLITRGRKVAIASVVAGVAVLIALAVGSSTFRTRISETVYMKTSSETERVLLWKAAAQMGMDHPVIGVGPGCWSDVLPAYIPANHGHWDSRAHPHSDPFYLWATTGALGLLAATALLVLIFDSGFRDLRKWLGKQFARDVYVGGLLSLFGFAMLSLFQCYLTDGENLLALGFVLGLALAARESWLRGWVSEHEDAPDANR